jgi:hypothetical protein
MLKGLDFSRFVLGAQASGAEVKVFRFAVDDDARRMDIRRPAPVGMAFGMADIGTVLRSFTA